MMCRSCGQPADYESNSGPLCMGCALTQCGYTPMARLAKDNNVTISDQPPPIPTMHRPAWEIVIEHMTSRPREDAYGPVHDMVIADMRERDRIGRERYGTPLTSHNGRNHLVDAYQEGLDLAVYLAAWLDEQGYTPTKAPYPLTGAGPAVWRVYCVQTMFREHIGTLLRLRAFIDELEAK